MKPKILVTREVFDETLEFLAAHCEVDSNQADVGLDPPTLAGRLADKDGVMCALTDRIDEALLARCRNLKVVANIAVGFNNIGSCSDSARNITADHFAGVARDEIVDSFVWCELIRQWSALNPEFAYLPRKFKIAVNGAEADRAGGLAQPASAVDPRMACEQCFGIWRDSR